MRVLSNLSLERTSASWPRYAHLLIIATRGQLSSAAQLQRYAPQESAYEVVV